MQNNFESCLAITLSYEGGFSNSRYDPGGTTYHGVTQRVYDVYRAREGSYKRSVGTASDIEITAIYKEQYWDAVRGDILYAGLDMVLFDIAVNSGPVTAIKFLQESLRVTVDGAFGLATLGALQKVNDRKGLIETICAKRVSFWHALTTFYRFGRGWLNRGVGIEEKALEMFAKG